MTVYSKQGDLPKQLKTLGRRDVYLFVAGPGLTRRSRTWTTNTICLCANVMSKTDRSQPMDVQKMHHSYSALRDRTKLNWY